MQEGLRRLIGRGAGKVYGHKVLRALWAEKTGWETLKAESKGVYEPFN